MNTVNKLPINFLKAVQLTTNYETQIYANMRYTVQKSTYKNPFWPGAKFSRSAPGHKRDV